MKMRNQLLFIATGVVAGAAIALGVERMVGKAGEERVKGDSHAVAPAAPRDTVREIRSLDELFAIDPKDTVIESCNLSHLGLKVLPDLSKYTIRRLDLSHNKLFFIPNGFFPKELEDLRLSHNDLYECVFPNDLRRLDISHNVMMRCGDILSKEEVNGGYRGFAPAKIIKKTQLRYLDISYDWDLYYKVPFDVDSVDTLIRVHAARGYKLERRWPEPITSNPPKEKPPVRSTRDTIIRKIMHKQ